ncbi:MAG: hydroxymethylglutaryl-CoA lyase [Rhodospirillaceae bacterium]|nr:hydroxymethylglutaryl-CoA lyase [Rhodospirillaceae bacterium]
MANFPKTVTFKEEGPREGFQIEKNFVPTARKIEFINALSKTGLKTIQIVSFVNPKLVPNMADAEEVVAGIDLEPGVEYTGLWLNAQGFERAKATGRLAMKGNLNLCASESFLQRNQNRTSEQQIAELSSTIERYKSHDMPIEQGGISAAFGCNFEGDVPVSKLVDLAKVIIDATAEHGVTLKQFMLLDTMGWGTPDRIKRALGALQDIYPDLEYALHLHDTRGMGIANAYAGLEMGIAHFDACVAGLGGCPFAGNKAAAGNVCTEDLVFMCEEMGIDTGLDLDVLAECARLAEDVVGHPLPGSIMRGGSLDNLREKSAA